MMRCFDDRRQELWCARGGLASHAVARIVLSGAALGHDRVRDGTGWGQRALGHGHTGTSVQVVIGNHGSAAWAMARRARPCAAVQGSKVKSECRATMRWARPSGEATWRVPPRCVARNATNWSCPPSPIRTARLRSVARLPPAAYQPGSLPGGLPLSSGDARLGV